MFLNLIYQECRASFNPYIHLFSFHKCVVAHNLPGGLRKTSLFSESPWRKADGILSEFIVQFLQTAVTSTNLKFCWLKGGEYIQKWDEPPSKRFAASLTSAIFTPFWYFSLTIHLLLLACWKADCNSTNTSFSFDLPSSFSLSLTTSCNSCSVQLKYTLVSYDFTSSLKFTFVQFTLLCLLVPTICTFTQSLLTSLLFGYDDKTVAWNQSFPKLYQTYA